MYINNTGFSFDWIIKLLSFLTLYITFAELVVVYKVLALMCQKSNPFCELQISKAFITYVQINNKKSVKLNAIYMLVAM